MWHIFQLRLDLVQLPHHTKAPGMQRQTVSLTFRSSSHISHSLLVKENWFISSPILQTYSERKLQGFNFITTVVLQNAPPRPSTK